MAIFQNVDRICICKMDVFLAKPPHSNGGKTRKKSPKTYSTYAGHYGSARKSELQACHSHVGKAQVISQHLTTNDGVECYKR